MSESAILALIRIRLQTIELRLGPQGVKAKWVRVELRKVETLPGGGQANTFFDFVGPSPVKVWESTDEWGILHTVSIPVSNTANSGTETPCNVARFPVCNSNTRIYPPYYLARKEWSVVFDLIFADGSDVVTDRISRHQI